MIDARGSGRPAGIRIRFSKPADPETATDAARYRLLDQPVEVRRVILMDAQTVLLETTPFEPGPLRVAAEGITDIAGSPLAGNQVLPVDLGRMDPAAFRPLVLVREPADQWLVEGQPVSWQVEVDGAPADWIRFRWSDSAGRVVDPAGPLWSPGPACLELDGLFVRAEAYFANGVGVPVISRLARLRVAPDRFVPRPVALEAAAGASRIRIRFSEPFDPLTANSPETWHLKGPARVSDVRLLPDGQTVELQTTPLPAEADLTLQIDGLTDLAAARNTLHTTLRFRPATPGYAASVLAAGPVRYWRFEETAGTRFASERTELDGPELGIATGVNDPAAGQPGLLPADPDGHAVAFDGAAVQYLQVPNGADLNTTAGPWPEKTVELWFRADRLPGVVARTPEVVTLYEQGGTTRALALYLYGTQAVANPASAALVWFAFNDATTDGPGDGWGPAQNNAVFVWTPVQADRVYHVVGVLAGDPTDALAGRLILYVNGEPIAQATGAGQLYAHPGDIRIGHGDFRRHDNRTEPTGHFTGVLDELALYNRALGPEEIAAHYEAGLRPPGGILLRPHLEARRFEDRLVLDFGGRLLQAPGLEGPWEEVSVTAPVLVPTRTGDAGPARFFRAVADRP